MGILTLHQKKNDEPGGSGKKLWKVYFEGSDNDLKEVSDVKYILPPTFPRDRVLGRKEDNFSMNVSGFNDIQIGLEVIPSNPNIPTQKLQYVLKRDDKDGSAVSITV